MQEEARRHFSCPVLEGMELENQGGTGTELNHWEKRLLEVWPYLLTPYCSSTSLISFVSSSLVSIFPPPTRSPFPLPPSFSPLFFSSSSSSCSSCYSSAISFSSSTTFISFIFLSSSSYFSSTHSFSSSFPTPPRPSLLPPTPPPFPSFSIFFSTSFSSFVLFFLHLVFVAISPPPPTPSLLFLLQYLFPSFYPLPPCHLYLLVPLLFCHALMALLSNRTRP